MRFEAMDSGNLNIFGAEFGINAAVFWGFLIFALVMLAVIYCLVKLNEAQRIITVNYAKRVHGNSSYGGIKSILPIKMIAAGVIPVIFATAFLSLPALVGQVVTTVDPGNELGASLVSIFSAPSANNFAVMYPNGITAKWFIYPALYFVLVFMFTFF